MARPPQSYKKEEINAKTAKKLTELAVDYKTWGKELENVLEVIEVTAKEGKSDLNWFAPLHDKTLEELEKRKFNLINHLRTSVQKNNLYYTISW